MLKQILGAAGAGLASLVFAATVVAASPTPSPSAATTQTRDTVPAVLGLTQAQVQALRHEGLSLAQIAEKQKVDPQRLIDALVARWTSRIDVRVTNGALTADEATKLKAEVQTRPGAWSTRSRSAVCRAPPSAPARGTGQVVGLEWGLARALAAWGPGPGRATGPARTELAGRSHRNVQGGRTVAGSAVLPC